MRKSRNHRSPSKDVSFGHFVEHPFRLVHSANARIKINESSLNKHV
uniref:Pentatricopeptide repeat-containing family protein n=1 Tax=Rhizophora mucronata TaxID=61149 RepID=A0A2P2NI90_RHIMU